MASAEDYAAWIVQNADKRGTPQFDTVAKAYELAKGGGDRRGRAPDALDNPNMATEGMSTTEKFLAGGNATLHRMAQGVGQLVGLTSQADVDQTDKQNAPLFQGETIAPIQGGKLGIHGNRPNRTMMSPGSVGGLVYGTAAMAPTAFIPGANTIIGSGLIGAGANALTTPGGIAERSTAALYGGAGGMAGQAIPRAIKVVKAASEPLTESGRNAIIGRVMNSAAGENADAVARRLATARELVPGSAPTAAEVGESGGIAALQRAMSAADPEAYAHRGMQQASARTNVLREIAGDEGQRDFYAANRATAAKDLYDEAYSKGVDLRRDATTGQFLTKGAQAARKGEITKLMQTPAMQEAAASAKQLMLNDPNLRGKVMDPAGSVQGLDYTRRALSDMINDAKPGTNQQRILINLRDRLDTTLDTISPKYAEARTTFREMSKPINQMDVGKVLLDKLQGPLADHGALASETAAKYAAALRGEGEATARSATGMRQGLADVLDPAQMDSVNAVAADLGRKSNAQNLGRGIGSNTFQNFAMDNLAAQGGMPSAVRSTLGAIPGLSPTMTLIAKGTGAVGNLAYKRADTLMREAMAKALLNPQESAALMEGAAKPELMIRVLKKLPQSVTKRIPPEDIMKVMQAAPGVLGATALPAYFHE